MINNGVIFYCSDCKNIQDEQKDCEKCGSNNVRRTFANGYGDSLI